VPKKARKLGPLVKPELPRSDAPPAPAKAIDDDFLKAAIDRADEAYRHESDNMSEAYEDLAFKAGDQWPIWAKQQREVQRRPILTINRVPQFVHQVTGDLRLMRPSIKVTPADGLAKPAIAELLSGMIRTIENRSEARVAYAIGADSQVSCGIGHWRVTTEYAQETTFNQEIRIVQIEDGLSVLWDPDSILPTREDALYCFVPVDMTREKFKRLYPDAPVEDFADYDSRFHSYWFDADRVRVAEYWEKRDARRLLAQMHDGSLMDLTAWEEGEIEALQASGRVAKLEERPGHKIFRSLLTLGHVLEAPAEWPGRMIPIVPVMGEEIRIGRKIVRHGLIRFMKDPQRLYNFARTTQAEYLALSPKAPFIGTDKNFEEHEDEWASANEQNWPYLRYTPDARNGNAAPQRQTPPMPSPGLSEAVSLAAEDMKGVTGIYDAGLGKSANEVSGVAIRARQYEGDVGTVQYADNFALAIRHTGRIVVDLIPHIYDTERLVQVQQADGSVDMVVINKALASGELEPEGTEQSVDPSATARSAKADMSGLDIVPGDAEDDAHIRGGGRAAVLNDVTIGAYGVVLDMGPSFSTRRQEARDGMEQLINVPGIGPLILDLYARAQDWPDASEVADRLAVMLPPPIQALIAAKKQRMLGEIATPVLPPPVPPVPPVTPPSPADIAAQQAETATAKAAAESAALGVKSKELDLQRDAIALEIKRLDLATKTADASQKTGAPQQALLQQILAELAQQRGMIEQLSGQGAAAQLEAPSSNAPPSPPTQ